MDRTGLDAHTLAHSLRRMAGDGSMEWVTEPMQTRVLLDVADMLDENAKLRELVRDMHKALFSLNLDHCQACPREDACVFMHKSFDCSECAFERDMRELGVEVDE